MSKTEHDLDTLRKSLQYSYVENQKIKRDSDFLLDESLSGKRVKVLYNPSTQKTFVVHRGTASATDWFKTNTKASVGIENGRRFTHAKNIQNIAENKYGRENITTLGHSLGGRIAEKVGTKSNQVITYNKAATIPTLFHKTPKNQIDIRTEKDPVSFLSKFQKHENETITIKNKSYNIIAAHNTDKLMVTR